MVWRNGGKLTKQENKCYFLGGQRNKDESGEQRI